MDIRGIERHVLRTECQAEHTTMSVHLVYQMTHRKLDQNTLPKCASASPPLRRTLMDQWASTNTASQYGQLMGAFAQKENDYFLAVTSLITERDASSQGK